MSSRSPPEDMPTNIEKYDLPVQNKQKDKKTVIEEWKNNINQN